MRLVVCDAPISSDVFLVKVSGDSLAEMGICNGDVLLIDRVESDNLIHGNPLVVRSSPAGLVIERSNGHNGFHGIVRRLVRRSFQAHSNRIELAATPYDQNL